MFDALHAIVDGAVRSGRNCQRTRDIHTLLMADARVREILEIEIPVIADVSEILEVSAGKVLAVRMDEAYGITGFKKPVIASLILKRLVEAVVRRRKQNTKWMDGGNVNSSLALAYYAKKFGGKATYVMSRFFPDYVLDYIRDVSEKSIDLIRAPNLSLGIERDFYRHLVDLIRNDSTYRTFQPLWHAKYGGTYTRCLGKELANKLNVCPDYIVTAIGAGSNLVGHAIPIRERFRNVPRIVVPEHSRSRLLNTQNTTQSAESTTARQKAFPSNWFSRPPNGIPHYVIGPHYDEINPLIGVEALACIGGVFGYADEDWMQMSFDCGSRGMEIGNSSAANLVAAKRLAREGRTVLTFIYEPFRSIYKGHNLSKREERAETRHPTVKGQGIAPLSVKQAVGR